MYKINIKIIVKKSWQISKNERLGLKTEVRITAPLFLNYVHNWVIEKTALELPRH